ncbi:MAG: cupin domain-containing protein [Planctomycetes bacterium]|nr:cupin domain-containing protein [Planctomycetota bacterium]MBM4082022.1 cupin domain-containing protein [Planctomycetota bacterium]
MFIRGFKDAKLDVRPECVCYYCLPEGTIGRLSAGVVEIEPGGSSLSCAHTAWRQVFFILDGEGWLVLDGKKRGRVRKDMVVEIPYDVEHKVVASKSGPLRYLYVNDYSQPVLKTQPESAAAYAKIKPAAKADLHRGEAKMKEPPGPLSPERLKLAQRLMKRGKK